MVIIWPLAYTLPVTFRVSGDAKFPMIVDIISFYILGGKL
jgi:Na+-driven multidrug efflux pump